MSDTYRHDTHSIDIRDRVLVNYDPRRKIITVRAEELEAKGIVPKWTPGANRSYFTIDLWSERLQTHIKYAEVQKVRSSNFDLIYTLYAPVIDESQSGYRESLGTELRIYNDLVYPETTSQKSEPRTLAQRKTDTRKTDPGVRSGICKCGTKLRTKNHGKWVGWHCPKCKSGGSYNV